GVLSDFNCCVFGVVLFFSCGYSCMRMAYFDPICYVCGSFFVIHERCGWWDTLLGRVREVRAVCLVFCWNSFVSNRYIVIIYLLFCGVALSVDGIFRSPVYRQFCFGLNVQHENAKNRIK
ncbi:MAG: hypothetical protein ACYC2W_11795, partial [Desulfurivibrionaceae bacterium]